MTTYQVSDKSPNQRYVRILGVVGITTMVGLLFISTHDLPAFSDSTNRALGFLGLVVVLATGSGAAILSARERLWSVKRRVRIEVSNEKIAEIHEDGASAEIPLRSINKIHEYPRGLIVSGPEPSRRVAVPREVVGFEELKQHLSAFSSIEPAKTKGFAGRVLHLAALILAFALLFLSHHRILILSIGILLLAYYAATFIHLSKLRQPGPLPRTISLGYILSVLITVWIVYMCAIASH